MSDLWVLCEHGETKRHLARPFRVPSGWTSCPGGRPAASSDGLILIQRNTEGDWPDDALKAIDDLGYVDPKWALNAIADSLAKESS